MKNIRFAGLGWRRRRRRFQLGIGPFQWQVAVETAIHFHQILPRTHHTLVAAAGGHHLADRDALWRNIETENVSTPNNTSKTRRSLSLASTADCFDSSTAKRARVATKAKMQQQKHAVHQPTLPACRTRLTLVGGALFTIYTLWRSCSLAAAVSAVCVATHSTTLSLYLLSPEEVGGAIRPSLSLLVSLVCICAAFHYYPILFFFFAPFDFTELLDVGGWVLSNQYRFEIQTQQQKGEQQRQRLKEVE